MKVYTRRRRKHTLEEKEEEKHDLINNLPDSILCFIISFLPIKEVIRTTILCKRWKKLWISIPSINFDLQNPKLLTHNEVFHHILRSHGGNIESCSIIHYIKKVEHQELQSWIKELTSKRMSINKLSLQSIGTAWPNLQLPFSRIFSCRSLHELELKNYLLSDGSPFEGCLNLKTLRLVSVSLSDKILNSMILNCELLENLSLFHCGGLKRLEIVDRNLKVLKIEFLRVKEIEIHDMGLRTLVIDSTTTCGKGYKIDTPNLQQLCVHHRNRKINSIGLEIVEICCQLRISPNKYVSPFENLQKLLLNLNLKDIRQAPMLGFILRMNRYLQELIIEIDDEWFNTSTHDCLPYDKSLYWSKCEIFDCVVHHLRRVKLKGFRGDVLEMEFASFLITKATKLKSITFQCHDYQFSRQEAAITMALLSLPRASLDVSIIIDKLVKRV